MQKTQVWDGFIRFFHWSMVALIALLYYSAENSLMELHFVAGFSLLSLLATRLIWGFIGSDTAKLSALIHSPKNTLAAIKGAAQETPGHNAAGSYMVIAFLILLVTQAVTGLMTTDDIMYDGPLVAMVSGDLSSLAGSLHHQIFDWILIAIALHITAIVVYKLKGKALVPPMITGKTTESYKQNAKMKSGWVGFAIFCVLLTALLTTWGAESVKTLLS
ncbi:cytochrome b/b6 domain-containing protein [Pseudoalteromonas sp.]|uniref:cytochrome b/b6 domain-containing protein n=1 Tax=Pseudoalteromonas sp. TaxID=53249 RepID=UPI00356944DF